MMNKDIISHLSSKYPERTKTCGSTLLTKSLYYFEDLFNVDLQHHEYSCGSLDQLALLIGKDFRNSDLLFDIAKEFSEIFDPEYCVTLDTWESAIRAVVGENAFEEDPSNMDRYRIVLTCFDFNSPPYADWHNELLSDSYSAHKLAESMAKEECANLNDVEGAYPPGSIHGTFEVDDCANNDFEVRWYEKMPEDREEDSCDIDWVTTYNVYPVKFNKNNISCEYRGFEINSSVDGFGVSHKGSVLKKCESLGDALNLADDICLACTKDKTYSFEAVHKLPLDVRLKFVQDNLQPADLAERSNPTRQSGLSI